MLPKIAIESLWSTPREYTRHPKLRSQMQTLNAKNSNGNAAEPLSKMSIDAPKMSIDATKPTGMMRGDAAEPSPKMSLDAPKLSLNAAEPWPQMSIDAPKLSLDAPKLSLNTAEPSPKMSIDAAKLTGMMRGNASNSSGKQKADD